MLLFPLSFLFDLAHAQGSTPERLCLTRRPPCTLWDLAADLNNESCSPRIVPCGTHENTLNKPALDAYLGDSRTMQILGGEDGSQDKECDTSDGQIDPYYDYARKMYLVRFRAPGSNSYGSWGGGSTTSSGIIPGCFEILMHAGECWIPPNSNEAEEHHTWGCMGRCGDTCGGSFCSNYGANCLRDDVCRYYFGTDECGDDLDRAARRDWKTSCIFPGRGSCESTQTDTMYHRENRICGGVGCVTSDGRPSAQDYFLPKRSSSDLFCEDQTAFDALMCASNAACLDCTSSNQTALEPPVCARGCAKISRAYPFCRCASWPATQRKYLPPSGVSLTIPQLTVTTPP